MATVKKKNTTHSRQLSYVWGLLRISMGLIFLWAFIDKVFGLGFTTCRDAKSGVVDVMCNQSWLQGGSPTSGFLKFAAQGPFEGFYQGLAGNQFIDWLFMLGLLGIGVGLLFGIAMKLSTASGILMLLMMWTAVLPPEHHPFIDDHIVNALVLVGVYLNDGQQKLGMGKWWKSRPFVQQYSVLE